MSGAFGLRVATYNVHGFRSGPEAVASVVRDLAPDVLLVQESGSRRTIRRFAETVGMSAATDPRSPIRRRVKDAVLVRPPLQVRERRLLRFARSSLVYPRGCLMARVRNQVGRSCWAVSVHLGLDGRERGRHARQLIATVDELEPSAPVVVGGDLNVELASNTVARIAARLADVSRADVPAPTFPASAPTARIDHLFASVGLRVVSAGTGGVGAATASDHLPVWADLELVADEG